MGDSFRHGHNRDLGFDDARRVVTIRRIGEAAERMNDAGPIVTTVLISPSHGDRQVVRDMFEEGELVEVFLDTPKEVPKACDPNGPDAKVRMGQRPDFSGIEVPYQRPQAA